MENDYKSLKNDLSQKKREVEKLTAEYNSLGLFSGTRKREIESEKNALNNHIAEIDKKIKAYEKEFPGMDRGDLISKKEKAQKQKSASKKNNNKKSNGKNKKKKSA